MKRRQLSWVIITLVLMAAIAGLIIVIRRLNQPANGSIKNSSGGTNAPKSYRTKEYLGKQISFQVDERYSLKASAQGASGLDSYIFTFSGPYRRLAVAVDNLPAGGFNEYPAVQTRTLHPDSYIKSSQSYNGQNYIIFAARDGSEVGAFGAHGSRVVSVDITMPEAQSTAASDLTNILKNLHWRS